MKHMRILTVALAALLMLVSGANLPAQQNARDDENLIRGLLRDRLYEVAADRIFDFVFKYPQHPRRERMLFEICELLVREDKRLKAVPLLSCYLQEFPGGPRREQITMMLAEAQIAIRELASAAEVLRSVIADGAFSAADHATARELLARLYLDQARYADAADLLEGIPIHRLSIEGRLTLAGSQQGLGEYDVAEETLRGIIATGRRDSMVVQRARAELAVLYVKTARYQDCLALLEGWQPSQDGEVSSVEKQTVYALASSHYHLGDYEQAYAALTPILIIGAEPAGAEPLENVLIALNEWKPAAELLKPRYAESKDTMNKREAGLKLADALVKAGAEAEAIAVLEELADESSTAEGKAGFLMRAADLAINMDSKRRLLDKVAALDPQPSPSLLLRQKSAVAEMLALEGDSQGALALLREGASRSSGSAAAAALIAIGKIHLAAGDIEAASEAFESAASATAMPGVRAQALQSLLSIRIRQRAWEGATVVFERLRKSVPAGRIAASAWRDYSTALAMRWMPSESADAAQKALITAADLPRDEETRLFLMLAGKAFEAGKFDLAKAVYSSLAGGEHDFAAKLGLIRCALGMGEWQEASGLCMELSESSGDEWVSAWARFTAARALKQTGDVERRTSILLSLARSTSAPFAESAVLELQEIALATGSHSAALRYDPLFVELSPEAQFEADQTLLRAQRAVRDGLYPQGERLYSVHPDPERMSVQHRYSFALALHFTGKTSEAAGLLRTIKPEELQVPQRVQRDLIIAESLVSEGSADGALAIYRSLLERNLPSKVRLEVLFGAARASEFAGRWAEAHESYRGYLEESKSFEPNLIRIEMVAEAFAAHGEAAEAAELYRRLMVLAEDAESAVRYSFQAAVTLEESGGGDKAADEFLKIAYQYPDVVPWPARSRLRAAAIYERLGSLEAAERQYRVVAETWPETPEGRTAAERLRAISVQREALKEEQLKAPRDDHRN